MVIIGDYASVKHFKGYEPRSLEIICSKEEKNKLISNKKIENNFILTDKGVDYFLYNDKPLKIYTKEDSLIYDKLSINAGSGESTIRFNSFGANYSLYRAKTRFRNKSISEWEHDFLLYTAYKKQLFEKVSKRNYNKLTILYNMLSYYAYVQKDSLMVSYTYGQDCKYDRNQFFTFVSKLVNSQYLRIVNDDFEFDKNRWNKLKHINQLYAVMELLYVDTITEYIIPLLDTNENVVNKSNKYFVTSVMNLMTSPTYPPWIKSFIEDNYEQIMSEYTNDYIITVLDLIKYDVLIPQD